MDGLAEKLKTLQSRILSGSIVLLSGSGLTTAINLTYNIVLARFLGPQGFGHATVVYTILTLISAVTLSFQLITAKMVAKQESLEQKAAVYHGFHRGAWGCGIVIGLILLSAQSQIASYLNLSDPILVGLIAVGCAFYVPLGSRRGYMQGIYGFRKFATNLVVEGAVRLVGSYAMVWSGIGVEGVVAANVTAIAVAYLSAAPKLAERAANPLSWSSSFHEISQAMVFFSGQVLINNCDIVLVEHYFQANEAGLYAAVAMVGRVIFSFSSAVVNTMLPIVAGTDEQERKDFKVIATSVLLVLGTGCALALGLGVTPGWIWTKFFGSGFEISGRYDLPYLLALYAITTVVYSVSVVLITFEMAFKIANTSWVQFAFSGFVIAGISRFHSSLREVILVQLVLMLALLVCVALPFAIKLMTEWGGRQRPTNSRSATLVRRISEDEVVSEFLKSDFQAPEFKDYQTSLGEIVSSPDLTNADENLKRRALFYLRHFSLWKEIPKATEWFEADIVESDLTQIRAFPRAHWRALAKGNFKITEIAERVRDYQLTVDSTFSSKIAEIREKISTDDPGFSAVILIGTNENEPLTVLDGNHRLVGAMLSSPGSLQKLRFLCGLSPRMTQCCWYNTNLLTLLRYAGNMVARAVRNPEAELARVLAKADQ